MVEIKVGEYVRTKKGIVYKADQDYYLQNSIPIKFATFSDRVVKHSPNIIDLIEVGDYVNGLRIESFVGNVIMTSGLMHGILVEDIKSIVTKEAFKSVSYEV